MGVPYTFGNATTSIPLSQLDANFNTGLTIGNTTVGLGNTVTTLGNVTLNNVNIVSGTIPTSTSIANGTSNVSISSSGGNINVTTAGTTAIFPQATGTVMVSGNMPAFSAYSSGGTAMTNVTYVKVTFDTEIFDTNNNFASSRFTPTVAGYYQINCNLVYLTTISIAHVVLALYKNGSVETYTNFIANVSNGSSINLSYVISMNGSTDYIEMFLYMQGTGTLSAQGGPQTTFNGVLVRAA
jgi:hypothetical protein